MLDYPDGPNILTRVIIRVRLEGKVGETAM